MHKLLASYERKLSESDEAHFGNAHVRKTMLAWSHIVEMLQRIRIRRKLYSISIFAYFQTICLCFSVPEDLFLLLLSFSIFSYSTLYFLYYKKSWRQYSRTHSCQENLSQAMSWGLSSPDESMQCASLFIYLLMGFLVITTYWRWATLGTIFIASFIHYFSVVLIDKKFR